MKSIWAKHKGFGIPVVGGAAVLAGWYLLVYSSIRGDSDRERQRLERLQQEARAQAQEGVASADTLAELEADLQRRGQDLGAQADRCRFLRPDWAQKVTDPRDAPIQFMSQLNDARERFQRKGLSPKGPTALGFSQEKPKPDVAVEYIDRLAAVIAVLEAMEAAGVRSVQKIDPFTDQFNAETPAYVPGMFVNGVKITVVFQAPSQAVFSTIHRLQAPAAAKPYLALLSMKAEQDDPGKDLLTATVEVAALQTDAAGSLTPPTEEQP